MDLSCPSTKTHLEDWNSLLELMISGLCISGSLHCPPWPEDGSWDGDDWTQDHCLWKWTIDGVSDGIVKCYFELYAQIMDHRLMSLRFWVDVCSRLQWKKTTSPGWSSTWTSSSCSLALLTLSRSAPLWATPPLLIRTWSNLEGNVGIRQSLFSFVIKPSHLVRSCQNLKATILSIKTQIITLLLYFEKSHSHLKSN